jgi:hypothetical protein
MGWVFERPSLTTIEVAWRWLFGLPLLAVCWMQLQRIFTALPPESAGLATLDPQNPWVAAVQLVNAWALYQPHVIATLRWLLPLAALGWVVVSGLGRSLLLKRLIFSVCEKATESGECTQKDTARAKANDDFAALTAPFDCAQGRLKVVPDTKRHHSAFFFHPLAMIVLQAVWLAGFGLVCWCWLRSMEWAATTHITPSAEPDLIGFSIWAIFLSLGFFTAWALVSWTMAIAPLLLLLEDRSVHSALGQSLRLGKAFTAKLVEINLVMGIVNLALLVLAMVLSAAPLPFSDQLGPGTLHWITALAAIFYFVASDYFQVVRLKGFVEFWKMFRAEQVSESES